LIRSLKYNNTKCISIHSNISSDLSEPFASDTDDEGDADLTFLKLTRTMLSRILFSGRFHPCCDSLIMKEDLIEGKALLVIFT
jgi:hypothetical protein